MELLLFLYRPIDDTLEYDFWDSMIIWNITAMYVTAYTVVIIVC